MSDLTSLPSVKTTPDMDQEAPAMPTFLLRSSSTPDWASIAPKPPKLRRSSSAEAHFLPDAMDTKEVHSLLKELAYHTDLSHKQLQELGERLHTHENSASAGSSASGS
eukprot:CAMPEP_0180528622 /NCGR_PEP_ID=MMETSP1036_2-20121128/60896_1 /TAXON_ID=632150 /ORGANISM="Azadinium spinosum, Strain 3D9" /LENGTH=107 /DNA_ID=CAMNT_0022542193 /DNA_START=18 /DNA_END=338 /DNA_ORIENTATION=+